MGCERIPKNTYNIEFTNKVENGELKNVSPFSKTYFFFIKKNICSYNKNFKIFFMSTNVTVRGCV